MQRAPPIASEETVGLAALTHLTKTRSFPTVTLVPRWRFGHKVLACAAAAPPTSGHISLYPILAALSPKR